MPALPIVGLPRAVGKVFKGFKDRGALGRAASAVRGSTGTGGMIHTPELGSPVHEARAASFRLLPSSAPA